MLPPWSSVCSSKRGKFDAFRYAIKQLKMCEGTLYRFCSRNCLDKFEAEPEKYLKPASGGTGGAS